MARFRQPANGRCAPSRQLPSTSSAAEMGAGNAKFSSSEIFAWPSDQASGLKVVRVHEIEQFAPSSVD